MKKTLWNGRWLLFVFLFAVLIVCGVSSLREDRGLSIAMILLGVMLIAGYAACFPMFFRFSEQGIALYYCFGVVSVFSPWPKISRIEDYATKYPFVRAYVIGYFDTKFLFHREACIPKNKKTTAQIEKYYHKTSE